MTQKTILLIITLSCILFSCNKNQLGSYYNYEAKCEGSSFDGYQKLMVWGTGITKEHAIEQAKKEALNTVIFKGVQKGIKGCQINPIVTEVNARQRYSEYFDRFFSNSITYSQFVTIVTKGIKQVEQKNDKETKVGIIVEIDMTALKNKLIEDQILKQQK